jgi:hypothetical protein
MRVEIDVSTRVAAFLFASCGIFETVSEQTQQLQLLDCPVGSFSHTGTMAIRIPDGHDRSLE